MFWDKFVRILIEPIEKTLRFEAAFSKIIFLGGFLFQNEK